MSLRRLARWRVIFTLSLAATVAAAGCQSGGEKPGESSSSAQVFRLDSGPLQEIRVNRDTDGRFVVSGFCYLPDDTRLTIALHDSSGQVVGRTRPVVANGLFTSLPVSSTGTESGSYEIGVSANFSPGEQPPSVLEETDGGRALEGEGMFLTQRGHPAFALRFPVEP